MARLLSINVGLPRDIAWQGKTVHIGIWKAPVQGRRVVRRLNIDGDGQGDLGGHAGEHRAVFVHQIESYHYWQSQLARNDFIYGQFGGNFTVDGLSDDEVRIGDRYRIGSAVFEVTQPRVTWPRPVHGTIATSSPCARPSARARPSPEGAERCKLSAEAVDGC
jgi:MOSC domain-containing protein YiiM